MKNLHLLIFLVLPYFSFAGGIKGIIKTSKNEPLAFSAIAVKGSNIGTMANAEGRYELTLAAGKYEILFQYLGFKTLTKTVEAGEGFTTLDIILEEQALNISEVRVGSNQEDAAYTIMRRAIAKARFHQLQVQSYTARAYIKGTALPTKIPFLLKNTLKKEGIEEGKAILNESVNEISFRQPNSYAQKVISTRNSIDNSAPSPNSFVQSSFYNPSTAGGAVSPLSPRAFGYYKFEYEGSFQENGLEVNKIKVIPRSYGNGVFKGSLYLIENTWAIHSLNLQTINDGISFDIRQVYSQVQDVWMPTNQQYKASGGMMGFAGEFKYVVSVNYQNLKTNPAFKESVTVLDEKYEKPSNNLSKSDLRTKKLEDLAKQQKEFSTKQLRKLVKEYEKQDKKARKEKKEDTNVTRSDSMTVDSLANKRTADYWNELRSVPLTALETVSYKNYDSVIIVKAAKVKADSSKAKKDSSGFNFGKIVFGGNYKLGKKWNLTYNGPLFNIRYNTVEGFATEASLSLNTTFDPKNTKKPTLFYFKPLVRYSLARNLFSGILSTGLSGNNKSIDLSGGRYIAQYNPNNPIGNNLNSIATLFFEQNLMKIYEKQFARVNFSWRRLGDVLSISGGLEYAQRNPLVNFEGAKPFINWKNREFTSNTPPNVELPTTDFKTNEALLLDLTLRLKPWQRYRLYNGQKRYFGDKSPVFTANYRKGMGKDADFDFLQLQVNHRIDLGIKTSLSYQLSAGAFLNNNKLAFMDFKHFMGNQFFFQTGDDVSTFRLLDYYLYSTKDRFVEAHGLLQFRRFIITRIPVVRISGIKENIFVNALTTPLSKSYTEVGYGIDGLIPGFPVFRVEVISNFVDLKYQSTGFRVGTSLRFGN